MTALEAVFGKMGAILAICPECDDLFRLSDARLYYSGNRPRSALDELDAEDEKLSREEERLDATEKSLRAAAASAGRRAAEKDMRRIDRVFSREKLNPQDVKLVCEPVEYVVFHGLSSGSVRQLIFLGAAPENKVAALRQQQVAEAVKKKRIKFELLRVLEDGSVDCKKAARRLPAS